MTEIFAISSQAKKKNCDTKIMRNSVAHQLKLLICGGKKNKLPLSVLKAIFNF